MEPTYAISDTGYIILPSRRTTSFTKRELACKCCGLFNYHPGSIERLQLVRDEIGLPMIPTSGCRCDAHNETVGGAKGSYHIGDTLPYKFLGQKGSLAFDIATMDGTYRGNLAYIMWKHGFSIGFNFKRNFLHGDLRMLLGRPQTTFSY